MPVSPEFIVKHIRPYGEAAYEKICEPRGEGSLYRWFIDRGIDPCLIDSVFSAWKITAEQIINKDNYKFFIYSACLATKTAWERKNARPHNNQESHSVFFMTEELIKELSYKSSFYKGEDFLFFPDKEIPVVISLEPDFSDVEIRLNVEGVSLQVDEKGYCHHLLRIL